MPTKGKSSGQTGERRKSGTAEGSALDLLQQDHREVEGYFEEYANLKGHEDKEALALKICLALQVHARIEEEVFYPAARGVLENGDLIDEAIVEHASAKQLIAEIESMEVGDQLLDAKVKVLGEQIQHHVQEEENELFPQLEGKLDLERVGQEMARLREEILTEVAEGADTL